MKAPVFATKLVKAPEFATVDPIANGDSHLRPSRNRAVLEAATDSCDSSLPFKRVELFAVAAKYEELIIVPPTVIKLFTIICVFTDKAFA